MKSTLRIIVDKLLSIPFPNREDVNRVKLEIAKEHNLERIPSNAEIIDVLKPNERSLLLPILRRKMARIISGVNVVAVMTEPRECPHGKCAYCPGGPEVGVPQSYTGREPASMRGAQNDYDPYRQVTSRINQLKAIGHDVDKVDLIIMGGTFPAAPREYQEFFIKGCLDALIGRQTPSLSEAKVSAETAHIRNVGITVETRPDCLNPEEIDHLLNLGVTRVELGVQNVYDDIYRLVDRGHNVQHVIMATKLLKDSGIKVCYHFMPGLPGSNPNRDLEGFREIFDNPSFRPDMIKIYPTLVIKGTKLYTWWMTGDYVPLTTEHALDLVTKMKEFVPKWVRIMRVQRDIPSPLIEAGVNKSNLRQLIHEELIRRGSQCDCIRCREVGQQRAEPEPENLKLMKEIFEASGGLENFISFEDMETNTLVGFIRLRIPSQEPHRVEIKSNSALIRELHVYGPMIPVGSKSDESWQHKGWGRRLLHEAERVALEEYDIQRLLVLSALGTREYYSDLGYERDGVYMAKSL